MTQTPFEDLEISLISQYRELLFGVFQEIESNPQTRRDLGKINARLRLIQKAAVSEGLSEKKISALIHEVHRSPRRIRKNK